MKTKTIDIQQIAVIGVMAAVICVLGPFSIPIGIVPISVTSLAIYFALYALGWKKGTVSYLIYLLIGLVGVPVFSGFGSGPAKLFGPTGGYLIGFIVMAVMAGTVIDRFQGNRVLHFIGLVAAASVCNLLGTLWLSYQAGIGFSAAFAAGVIPFIPGDLMKIIIAVIVGPKIRNQLIRANLYNA